MESVGLPSFDKARNSVPMLGVESKEENFCNDKEVFFFFVPAVAFSSKVRF